MKKYVLVEIEHTDSGIATDLTAEHVSLDDMMASIINIVSVISQETGDSTQKIFDDAKRSAMLEEAFQGKNVSPLDILKEVLNHA